MTLSTYLIGISVSTLLCWTAWGLTIINVDPQTTGSWGIVSFFISLFFAIVGTFTIIGFYLRLWFTSNEYYYENITISFRQAILVSVVVVGLLGLQALRILNLFDGILFISSILLLEFYFLARRE